MGAFLEEGSLERRVYCFPISSGVNVLRSHTELSWNNPFCATFALLPNSASENGIYFDIHVLNRHFSSIYVEMPRQTYFLSWLWRPLYFLGPAVEKQINMKITSKDGVSAGMKVQGRIVQRPCAFALPPAHLATRRIGCSLSQKFEMSFQDLDNEYIWFGMVMLAKQRVAVLHFTLK